MKSRYGIMMFESWSYSQIATEINDAVSGFGTYEEGLVAAIMQIPNRQSVIEVNKIMSGSPDFAYKTIGAAVDGELGTFDGGYSKQITDHLTKIGAIDVINKTQEMAVVATPNVISQILPRVIKHEGAKPKVYTDSRGIPTVGIGFNLTREDSVSRLQEVGANFQKIKSGQASLTDAQMQSLLKTDLAAAKTSAESLVPNFNQLPINVQGVLIEMAFNLGKKGLSEFKNFLSNVSMRNWTEAADEMLNSSWANQVGNRADTLADIVRTA